MSEGTKLLPSYETSSTSSIRAIATTHNAMLSSYLGLATTMMGSCILTLPGTLEAVGVIPGSIIFILAAWLTYQSFQMICMACDVTGEYSYESLCSRLFGASGVWIVRILTLVLLFGSVVTYMVIAMDLFEPFFTTIMERNTIGLVFAIIAIPLCLPETIYELRYCNGLVILCILYILVALAIRCVQQDDEAFTAHIQVNKTNQFTSEIAAISYVLPIVSLSFACQLNIPRAYQELADRKAMRMVTRSLVVTGLVVYVSFAILGYLCFHGHPPSDILTGFAADDRLINGARVCLGASMILKTPMTFQPLRQAVELVWLGHNRQNMKFRAGITIFFMLMAHALSITSRDLGVVMSFIGALAGNVLTITVPGWFVYEIGKGYVYDRQANGSHRLAIIMTITGVVFSVSSLTYLAFNAVEY